MFLPLRCRANMAHIPHSRPGSGLDLQVKVVETFGLFSGRSRRCARSRKASSDDLFQETSARYRAVEPEQWLQRHSEAGSSWPSWPKASRELGPFDADISKELISGDTTPFRMTRVTM